MAVQLELTTKDNQFGVDFTQAYARITQVVIDYNHKAMQFSSSVWANAAARTADKQPLMSLPPIAIRKEATPAQWKQLVDEAGVPILGEDGKPTMIQTSPALPSFADVETLIGQAILEGKDYRTVGYNLLKKLDVVKNNKPVDV